MIPKEIKEALLKEYVKRCIEMHSIAFLQWRLKYPSKVSYNKELVEDMVRLRISHLYLSVNPDQAVSDLTLDSGHIDKDFVKEYFEFNMPEGVYQPYFINSFSSLGW